MCRSHRIRDISDLFHVSDLPAPGWVSFLLWCFPIIIAERSCRTDRQLPGCMDGNMGAIKIQVGLFVIMQIVAVLYLILLILNKYRYIQPVVIGIAITEMFLSDYAAYGTVADNVMAFMFFMPMVVMSLLELALQKMIDVYDEALARSRNYEVQEQEKKEEAHRRLDFPGKYTKLFYHMIWKNFRSDWKDYRLFLLCGIMVGTLAFSGLGAYEMLSSSHRTDLSMYGGEGLGRILINAMIPLAACCLFLMVFVPEIIPVT